jgi:hypothetical protein
MVLPEEVLELIAGCLDDRRGGGQHRARFSFQALSRAVAATVRRLVMGTKGPLPAEAWVRFPAAVALLIRDSQCWFECSEGTMAATCKSYVQWLEQTLAAAPARVQELSFENSLCRNEHTLVKHQVRGCRSCIWLPSCSSVPGCVQQGAQLVAVCCPQVAALLHSRFRLGLRKLDFGRIEVRIDQAVQLLQVGGGVRHASCLPAACELPVVAGGRHAPGCTERAARRTAGVGAASTPAEPRGCGAVQGLPNLTDLTLKVEASHSRGESAPCFPPEASPTQLTSLKLCIEWVDQW